MKASHAMTGERDRHREGETEGWGEDETERRRDEEFGYLSVPPSLRHSVSPSLYPSVTYSPGPASRGMAASGGC